MDPKELKKIIKLCREQGVLTYKTKDLELTLSPEALKTKAKTQTDNIEMDPPMNEEDVLLWSSSGVGN